MTSLGQRLDLRQGQSLVMTPQLQQSLKMLQYSSQELVDFIELEVEKNPLLEVSEGSDDVKTEAIDDVEEKHHSEQDVVNKSEEENIPTQEQNDLDVNYEDVWDKSTEDKCYEPPAELDGGNLRIEAKDQNSDYSSWDKAAHMERTISKEVSLREYITTQINLEFNAADKKIIAIYMLDALDERGYIAVNFQEVATNFECDKSMVEEVLFRLQKLDPIGVFSRSLQECLSLQLKEKNRCDPAMEKLLANLNILANGDLKKLQKICAVDEEDLSQMCREIRELNPKPASDFTTQATETIMADIFLTKNAENAWSLELNSDSLPKVLVNRKYYAEVKKLSKNEDEKKFVTENFNNANWLVKALNQRAETILKVATELVSQQNDFFERGICYLKPMILADIAKKLGIHESTVGRVTTNKYIATPRGLFEMKFFFSSSIGNSEGDGMSSKTVKHLIKELIDKELTAKDVLSDDKIVNLLKIQGVDLARRTVAKYRESMRIPPSPQRRKEKRMA